MTNELLDKCDVRRKLKGRRNLRDEDVTKYKEANKKVKREVTRTKEKWLNSKCTRLRKFFETRSCI